MKGMIKHEDRAWRRNGVLPSRECSRGSGAQDIVRRAVELLIDRIHDDQNPEESSCYVGTYSRAAVG